MPRRTRDEMFAQLTAVYESFGEAAVMENTDDGERLVWTGFVTALFKSHGLEGPSYTRVRDELIRLEAIEPKHQGYGQSKSVYYIGDRPTREAWDALRDGAGTLRGLTRMKQPLQTAALATKVQRLEDLFAELAKDYQRHKEQCE